jgi:hypothetical protein
VAIGEQAGYCTQRFGAVAIGRSAGVYFQGHGSVAIGKVAGYCNQGADSVAIGSYAGQYDQEDQAVAIGNYAGSGRQDSGAIAVGSYAGYCGQACYAVAIGYYAGYCCQKAGAVAIGYNAGYCGQHTGAVAIGYNAGKVCQGINAVAIGYQAGYGACNSPGNSPQGQYSVAIGYRAGYLSQVANSIAINASIDSLNPGAAGLYINPVREDVGNTEYSVYYNDMTKELTYTVPVALQLPQNLQSGAGAYTLVLGDAGKHVYKTGTGNVLIDINANVAFPIGSVVTLVTGSAHPTTIQTVNGATTTLILSKFGMDNNINVPADTYVTLLKIETDKWMIQT